MKGWRALSRGIQRGLAALAAWAARRPWHALGVAVLVTVLSVLSATRLRVDADIANMLPRSFESVQNLERLKKRVGGIGFVTVRVEGVSVEALRRFAHDIVPRLEALPTVRYVDWKRPLQWFRDRALYFMDLEDLEEVYQRVHKRVVWHKLRANPLYVDIEDTPKPKIELADIKDKYKDGGVKARGENKRRGRLANWREGEALYLDVDARQLAILVKPKGLASDVDFARRVVGDVQRILDGVDKKKYGAGLRLYIHGRYRNRTQQQSGVRRDLRVATIAAIVLMLLYLGVHFRRFAAVPLVLVPLFLGLAWTFGVAGLVNPTLNLLSAFIAVILLGMGIDHGIHLLARYQTVYREGKRGEEAVRAAFGHTGLSLVVAAVTTSVAFIGLSISEFRGFREFGRLAAVGTFLVVLAYVFCLPALLTLLHKLRWKPSGGGGTGALVRRARLSLRAGRATAVAILVLAAGAVAVVALQMPQARFDYNFRRLNARTDQPPPVETLTARQVVPGRGGAAPGARPAPQKPVAPKRPKNHPGRHVNTSELIGRSEAKLVVFTRTDAEALAAAKELRRRRARLGARSGIDFVITSGDFVPEKQAEKRKVILKIVRDLREAEDKDYSVKERDRLAELRKYRELQPFRAAELPIELRRIFAADAKPGAEAALGSFALVFVRIDMHDGARVRALARELRDIPIGGGRQVSAAGEEMILADVLELIFRETPKVMGYTLVGVFLVVWLLVGLRRALLCLMPPLLTVVATIGLVPLLDLKFNYLNVIMIPVLFGLAVDGGVHLVLAYDDSGDLPGTLAGTGRAVVGALITTALGFGALGLANHAGLQSLAWVTLIGLACALLLTVVVLPAVLGLSGRSRERRRADRQPASAGPAVSA